jgi:alpha-1,3-mannosyltransferase
MAFLLFSIALSVKMSVLLYIPGLLVVLFRRHGLVGTLEHITLLLCFQFSVALPFILKNARTYLAGAFDLGRVFLYKWTVNWRFVSEEHFLSSTFALALLVTHVAVLVSFGVRKWCVADGGVRAILERGLRRPRFSPAFVPVDADCTYYSFFTLTILMIPLLDVTTVLYTSNLIGIVFARSLHYQFYSWYAQQLPFLLWRTKYPIQVK